MPKAIQIRDVPDEVHRQLRIQAAAAGMSLSEYLRREILTTAGKPPIAEVIDRVRAVGESTATRKDIVDLIRADRGRFPEEE